jgi:hypothetical protein
MENIRGQISMKLPMKIFTLIINDRIADKIKIKIIKNIFKGDSINKITQHYLPM